MDSSFIAYIDESGGHGFNFNSEGTSKNFVVNAILVERDKHDSLLKDFEKIKLKYFPESELKSSKIGNKENIRQSLLNEVSTLDFKIYCLVVNKQKIYPNSGLQYKESFYKFLYGILYNSIYRTFNSIEVVADELISSEFIQSFEKYITTNYLVDLFHQNKITFKKSTHALLLQLSDLIGGSINRFHSQKSTLNPLEILGTKVLSKNIWPEEYIPYTVEDYDDTEEFQEEISKLSLLRINDYINKNIKTEDNVIRIRVMCLSYLLSVFLYNSKTRFIFTQEILDHIQGNVSHDIKEQFLRQQIIGPLRSEGILIVSNSNGYKIPSSKKDIITFFNLFSKIINPMVNRLKTSHEALYQATNGKLNLLDFPEFAYLKKLIELPK